MLPCVPAAVLAQVWRGGPQPLLSRLLRGTQLEPLADQGARLAGVALARSNTSDVPDATVVVSAVQHQNAVVTSDRADIEHLANAFGGRPAIIDV